MLSFHRLCLPLLGAALLAEPAAAQTKPARKVASKPAARPVPGTASAARAADPLRGTNNNGAGQNGYAAPGEPIQSPDAGGKNTAPYSGPAAKPTKSSTLPAPKADY